MGSIPIPTSNLKQIKYMHIWSNLSIFKGNNKTRKFTANRPKGLKDEEWKAMVAEYRLNRQLMTNTAPKLSRKESK